MYKLICLERKKIDHPIISFANNILPAECQAFLPDHTGTVLATPARLDVKSRFKSCPVWGFIPVSPGKNPSDEYLEGMMSEAPGPINFTMFLTMFGERLNGTDPEDVIRNAFTCFDEDASGTAFILENK